MKFCDLNSQELEEERELLVTEIVWTSVCNMIGAQRESRDTNGMRLPRSVQNMFNLIVEVCKFTEFSKQTLFK